MNWYKIAQMSPGRGRGARYQYSPEDMEQISKMYERGVSPSEIVKRFGGGHPRKIVRVLSDMGHDMSSYHKWLNYPNNPNRIPMVDPEEAGEIIRLHEKGLGIVEIARLTGSDWARIKRILELAGLRNIDQRYNHNINIEDPIEEIGVTEKELEQGVRVAQLNTPSSYMEIGHQGNEYHDRDIDEVDIILFAHDGKNLTQKRTGSASFHITDMYDATTGSVANGRIDIKKNIGSIGVEDGPTLRRSRRHVKRLEIALVDIVNSFPGVNFFVFGSLGDRGFAPMSVYQYLKSLKEPVLAQTVGPHYEDIGHKIGSPIILFMYDETGIHEYKDVARYLTEEEKEISGWDDDFENPRFTHYDAFGTEDKNWLVSGRIETSNNRGSISINTFYKLAPGFDQNFNRQKMWVKLLVRALIDIKGKYPDVNFTVFEQKYTTTLNDYLNKIMTEHSFL